MRIPSKAWTVATILIAATLYVLALRGDFYEATSPHWLTWHVALRKVYSIGAFFTVAFALRKALAENGQTRYVLPCIVGTALYSAAIELGQFAVGSREGLGWNVFDTSCGAVGGALAAVIPPPVRARPPR